MIEIIISSVIIPIMLWMFEYIKLSIPKKVYTIDNEGKKTLYWYVPRRLFKKQMEKSVLSNKGLWVSETEQESVYLIQEKPKPITNK